MSASTTRAGSRSTSRVSLLGRAGEGLGRAGDAAEARIRHLALASLASGLALADAGSGAPLLASGIAAAAFAAVAAPRAALVALSAILAGSGAGHARLHAIDRTAASAPPGAHVSGTAHLLGPLRAGRFGASVEIRMASGRSRGARLLARLPPRARLPPAAGPGSEVELAGLVRAPRRRPGSRFDARAFQRRRGLGGELAVERVRFTGRRRGGLAGLVDAARRRAEGALAAGLPHPSAALARGMVLGEDEEIDPAVRQDFRDSGLAHLLAVSGQNVMLLAALALPLLAVAGLPPGARIAIAVALIAVYVPLAGAGPSLQRAGVMGAASLLALAAARPASRWYSLLLAACATLALNPRTCGDPGWQLSFAAVAGILLIAPGLRSALAALPRTLAEGVAITLAATLATAPLMAYHFGAVPLAGLPANVVALPLVAPIMWLGMLRAALGQVPAGAAAGAGLLGIPIAVAGQAAAIVNDLLGLVLEPLTKALAGVATTFAELPGGRLGLPLSSRAGVALGYAAIAAVGLGVRRLIARVDTAPAEAAWRRLPVNRRVAVACTLGVLLALAFLRTTAPPAPPRELTVSFLDVGQGDATLIQHPDGSAVLFDGGPPEGRVARLLRRAGVRKLSAVVMTHMSRDHHGGLAEVVARYPIDLLLDGGDGTRDPTFRAVVAAAERRGVRRVRATAPLVVHAGSLTIRVLGPRPRPPGPRLGDANLRAVVAVVSSGWFDLFLSADAESPSIEPLVLSDVDAMKVPHHGSSDTGLPAILARLRPEVAGIEVGRHNSYGHPAPSTLATLRAAHVETFRTDRDGTVRLTVGPRGMRVTREHGGAVGAVAVGGG